MTILSNFVSNHVCLYLRHDGIFCYVFNYFKQFSEYIEVSSKRQNKLSLKE